MCDPSQLFRSRSSWSVSPVVACMSTIPCGAGRNRHLAICSKAGPVLVNMHQQAYDAFQAPARCVLHLDFARVDAETSLHPHSPPLRPVPVQERNSNSSIPRLRVSRITCLPTREHAAIHLVCARDQGGDQFPPGCRGMSVRNILCCRGTASSIYPLFLDSKNIRCMTNTAESERARSRSRLAGESV